MGLARPRSERRGAPATSRTVRRAERAEASEDHQHWFEPIAEHLGSAYLRYSFTKGTVQEIDFVVGALGLQPGDRVLDVGCGPGRHAHELARRGFVVHGIDICQRFIDLATARRTAGCDIRAARCPPAAVRCGVRRGDLPVPGRLRTDDCGRRRPGRARRYRSRTRAGGQTRPRPRSAPTSRSSTTKRRPSTPTPASATSAPRSATRTARAVEVDLWTACYTPRELRLMFAACRPRRRPTLERRARCVRRTAPTTETPEFLVIARRTFEVTAADQRWYPRLGPEFAGPFPAVLIESDCPLSDTTTFSVASGAMGTFDEEGNYHPPPGHRRRPGHVLCRCHRRHDGRSRGRSAGHRHGRQDRQGRGAARHRVQERGRHPGPRAEHSQRCQPARDRHARREDRSARPPEGRQRGSSAALQEAGAVRAGVGHDREDQGSRRHGRGSGDRGRQGRSHRRHRSAWLPARVARRAAPCARPRSRTSARPCRPRSSSSTRTATTSCSAAAPSSKRRRRSHATASSPT